MTETLRDYALGCSDPEIARLDAQSASLEAPTRLLLRAAGIGPGMRVLDLGTGLGDVARLLAEQVGASDGTGSVIGIDTSAKLLALAAARTSVYPLVRFVHGDVRTWRDAEPFDAIVGRLILFHLPDAVAVLEHQVAALHRGGLLLALDFDLGSTRAEPPVPLADEALGWVRAAFRRAGADATIGTRLALLLAGAGLENVRTFGVQGYLAPDDPRGPALLCGVVRTLAPQIIAGGIASAEQIGIATLEQRLGAAVQASGSVVLPPALVGAWGYRH
jgi:SAM-dependent methyltransferase